MCEVRWVRCCSTICNIARSHFLPAVGRFAGAFVSVMSLLADTRYHGESFTGMSSFVCFDRPLTLKPQTTDSRKDLSKISSSSVEQGLR